MQDGKLSIRALLRAGVGATACRISSRGGEPGLLDDAAETAAIDAGLRAYMLRVYNYMVIGLAITGFAALGIYTLSVRLTSPTPPSPRAAIPIPARLAVHSTSLTRSATRCS